MYQPSHLPPSPQDPLFPAGLPSHIAPSSCASDLATADHCAHLQTIFTYLERTSLHCVDIMFAAVRENRTRGGRNKFGPIYRRDRALRRQLHIQRLQKEGAVVGSYPNDKLYFPEFGSLSHDVDVKPTAAELASLSAQNLSPSSFHRDDDFLTYHRRTWREAHDSGSCSVPKDFAHSSFPQFSRQTGSAVVSPPAQRSIDDMAAAAVADVFDPRFIMDEDQTLRPSIFHRHHSYQPCSQNPSAPSAPGYQFVSQSSCVTSGSVSANLSPGFSQNICLDFPTVPPGETCQMPARCHYLQPSSTSSHHSASSVTFSQYRSGVSQSMHATYHHHRYRPHHPQYTHYHHHQQQQQPHRSGQQQLQTSSCVPQSPEVKQVRLEEPVSASPGEDSTSTEFISEADVAARRLPVALKLINDLQRRDARLCDSIDQLRCYADELLEQLQNCAMTGNGDSGTSLELDSTAVTRQTIIMACQLCDQALFVLVEWARHAHFFRQLPVSSGLDVVTCSVVIPYSCQTVVCLLFLQLNSLN